MLFYITINRCIITIRINIALIDYLANIGNSIGLIKTQSVSLSQNIYNIIANCKIKNFKSTLHYTMSRQAVAVAPSTCSVQ